MCFMIHGNVGHRIAVQTSCGALAQISFRKDPVFGFEIPGSCPNVPNEILTPENTWKDKEAFIHTQQKVANLFRQNFSSFASGVNPEIVAAGPQ